MYSKRNVQAASKLNHKASAPGGNEFRLMDVSVSILGLTGIMMENKSKKKNNKKSSDEDDGFPVKAVVSFFKNVSSSQTAIASHLPSLSLRSTDSEDDSKYRFNATWPTDFDPMGNELSTFKFSRMMQIDDANKYYHSQQPLMIPERIQLTLALTRGSEMITLGSVFLIITGDGAQDIQVNLPIILEDASKKRKKKIRKVIKPISFEKDQSKKFYNLHGNACLKVLMSVSAAEKSLGSHSNLSRDIPDMQQLSSGSGSQSYACEDLPVYQQNMGYNHHYEGHLHASRSAHMIHHNDNSHHRSHHPEVLVHDNDETTVGDYTVDETVDDTVMTDDTRKPSAMARMSDWLSCAGGMCSVYPTAFRSNQQEHHRYSFRSPRQSDSRRGKNTSRRGSDDRDDERHYPYEEYKGRMMKHPYKTTPQRQVRRKTNSRDDCSVVTAKMQNFR
jgi:hypothetical protein